LQAPASGLLMQFCSNAGFYHFSNLSEKLMMKELDSDYTAAVDKMNDADWSHLLGEFADANIYQTGPYGAVHFGRNNLSRLVLKKGGRVCAAAQAAQKTVAGGSWGVAYIYWGPLWQRKDTPADGSIFRMMIRALHNEYAIRRGLALRLLPVLYDDDRPGLKDILAEEGFKFLPHIRRQKTMIIDLRAPLKDLRAGNGATVLTAPKETALRFRKELKTASLPSFSAFTGRCTAGKNSQRHRMRENSGLSSKRCPLIPQCGFLFAVKTVKRWPAPLSAHSAIPAFTSTAPQATKEWAAMPLISSSGAYSNG
jgi:hypothetical protein